MIILRGLAGVLIGVVYGLFVGVVVLLLTRIGLDTEHPGPLIIIDPVGMVWLATVMSALIAGFCAAVLGLIVSLANVRKAKAATIGFSSGLVVFLLLSITSPLVPSSLRDWVTLFVTLAVLPCGLALISLLVAIVTARLRSFDDLRRSTATRP